MAQGELKERVFALERGVERVEGRLERLALQLEKQSDRMETMQQKMDLRHQREEVLMAALGIRPSASIGDRGSLEEMDDAILRLEDYLLAMGERVQRILEMFQGHREFMDHVRENVVIDGQRERMILELDIMMNSISILVMMGIEVDPAIPTQVEELKKALRDKGQDINGLNAKKSLLQQKLETEIKKYDLGQLFEKKKEIPGYL